MRRDLSAIGAAVVLLGSIVAAAPASAELATAAPLTSTGAEQSYTVPAGVTWLAMTTAGAPGWDTQTNQTGSVGDNDPGYEVYGMLPVTPGQQLFAEVGQAGLASGAATFGGGGAGGAGSQAPGASGGGASDVRTCSMTAASCPGGIGSLASRLIVGGGGGGSGGNTIAPGSPAAADFIAALGGGGCTQGTTLSSCKTDSVSGGTVIEGGAAGTGNATYDPGWVAAGGGTTAGGAPGVLTTSTLNYSGENGCVMSGGVTGATGTFGVGAAGPSGNADGGGGGGGGGGYYGGGSGSSGRAASGGTCSTPPPTGIGTGGGSGSSFLSSQLVNTSFNNHLDNSGVVTTAGVTLQPLIALTAPANGATFTQGQVVDAAYDCYYSNYTSQYCAGSEQAPGATSSTSVASGAAIDTSIPGQHTFTVKNAWASGPSTVQTVITYTVTASGPTGPTGTAGPTGHGSFSSVTGRHPKLSLTVSAGKGAPSLAKLAIGPPSGMSFVKKGLKKGMSLSHGALTVKASPPAASISVSKLALKISKGLLTKIKSKKLTSVTFTVEVTDSAGNATKLSVKLRV